MNISAAMVKDLRLKTGAGMMDCKKALIEAEGDLDKAVDILRKKGIAKAAKKADRVASEGAITIEISDDYKCATISEINSETDFVAQNDNFQALVKKATKHIHVTAPDTVEDLLETEIDGIKFEEFMKAQIAKIGENIIVRRFDRICVEGNGVVNGYLHMGGKIGVIVAAVCDKPEVCDSIKDILKDIAMHIAAMNPKYLDESSIPESVIEKEKEIAVAQLEKEGKPANIIEKILPGKIKKFVEENTLLGQKFVKDDKKTVRQVLEEAAKKAGGTAKIVEFVRYELGEGIEKKGCSFAEEVAQQLGE
ncbi:translation elongation factor Ts [Nitrosophilus alvini]|uniref:translation elongation factor Ts n=1 Tax=Nitrosophilus alvini TaxID=2714855 RepID=UPI001F298483|nr:translation elongation factor Ts [Nitrosophilus alvini]